MKNLFWIFLFITVFRSTGYSQDALVSLRLRNFTIEGVLVEIANQTGYQFYYSESGLIKNTDIVSVSWNKTPVSDALTELFAGRGILFRVTGRNVELYKTTTATNTVQTAVPKTKGRYTVSGFIWDSLNNEILVDAKVLCKINSIATSTNRFGFYSMTLPEGEVELVCSMEGYNPQTVKFSLYRDWIREVNLSREGDFEEVHHLKDVEITADKITRNLESTQMSMINIPLDQIKSLPATLGTNDVMRALQLTPGIQAGSEGSTGLHVRGGSPDQNLILLDGVPIYNASHLLSFVSLFNGDALSNVSVYKGSFPAKYGGRVSSVIDISMKNGSTQKIKGEGSIGLLWSNLTFEGPIVKGRTSIIVSSRRTYLNFLMDPLIKFVSHLSGGDLLTQVQSSVAKSGYQFYDMTAKINHRFSDKDWIYLSAYMGDDILNRSNDFKTKQQNEYFSSNNKLNWKWGNFMTSLRWNHVFSNRLFCNTMLAYNRYRDNYNYKVDSKRTFGETAIVSHFSELQNDFGIQDWIGKINFDYNHLTEHHVRFGIGVTYHTFNPGRVSFRDATGENNFGASERNVYEYSAYVEDNIRLSERLSSSIGLHWSAFSVGDRFYNFLQPRISTRYMISPKFTVKASYSRMAQYTHLLSNTYDGFPRDIWLPATELLPPQTANQYALGFAKIFIDNSDISLEGYYKDLKNVTEFKEGSSFFNMDESWEKRLLQGNGRSYGIELSAQKKKKTFSGTLTGLMGYTLSWTDRHFAELNDGKRFPYKYDRRHDFSIAIMQYFERFMMKNDIEISGAWVFSSGQCITLPVGAVDIGHPILHGTHEWHTRQYLLYSKRNDYRMEPYHRLDLSISFIRQKKWGERRWVWSVYNAYNRKNPYFIDVEQNLRGRFRYVQYSLFPMIPSLSYQFKF